MVHDNLSVVNTAITSDTTAGKAIKDLVNHPGGGMLDKNSTVVREYTGGDTGYWPGTSTDNIGGSGANVSSGIYTYELNDGTQRDPSFTLLHELLHAYDINVNGHVPVPGGDPNREREINEQVTALLNDSKVKSAFNSISEQNPPKGTIKQGKGLQE